ncbi:MAG TPA: beta-ketoacyl synthase chain length factor [Acidiferrobacter sp.]|nr:beta-ketoacyl synthase chain length factor [Acidiferrobacter sp.]
MSCFVAGLGVLAPGLSGRSNALRVLRGDDAYGSQGGCVPQFTGLAANEARRCPTTARYALDVGQQALEEAAWEAARVATIFSSGSGDLEILDKNCRALIQTPIALSPTLFHNSVHNAVAGYWGIAMGSRASTTSLSVFDDSFAGGLLEALMMASLGTPALLVAYDIPAPPALALVRPIKEPFAVALALCLERPAGACTRIDWAWEPRSTEGSVVDLPGLETLRTTNPAARSLPLLQAIARLQATRIVLPYLAHGQLRLDVCPVSAVTPADHRP